MRRRHVTPRLLSTLRAGREAARLDAWLSHVEPGITVAELAASWWPDIGDPRGWRVGSYPSWAVRNTRERVRRLERAGFVVTKPGRLRHRSQTGVVVHPVEKVARQVRMWGAA